MSIEAAREKIRAALRELEAGRPATAQLDLSVALEELDDAEDRKREVIKRLKRLQL